MLIDIDGNIINYTIKGEGATPILFLHGWACTNSIFDPFKNTLINEFKVIGVDFPGHGDSHEPNSTFKVCDFAFIIVKLLEKLDIEKVNIVAHSFGGRVAIWLASHYPDTVNKIIITGGAGIKLEDNHKLSRKTISYKRKKKIFEILKNTGIFNNLLLNIEEKLIQKYGSKDYIALSPNMRKTFISIINEDLTPYLSEISAPTVLIWGENDTETPVEYGKIMQERIKDSALIIFENCGHFAFLEQYNKFLQILLSFLREDKVV